jgi:hypothetical protein
MAKKWLRPLFKEACIHELFVLQLLTHQAYAPGVIRTHNLLIRSQMLYPVELRVRNRMGRVLPRTRKSRAGKRSSRSTSRRARSQNPGARRCGVGHVLVFEGALGPHISVIGGSVLSHFWS